MRIRAWERDNSLLAIEVISRTPFEWAIGLDGSQFFREIREKEVLIGIKCPSCGKVYVPPRLVCGPCFAKMDELVELGKEGVIEALTLVNYPFIDPDTGERRPIPYFYGYIKLDGADNLFSHVVRSSNGSVIRVGDRVRAVFSSSKLGRIQDISHFEPIEEKD